MDFINGVNCIVGPNGIGKTNVLEAIFYILNGKDYNHILDKDIITKGEMAFILKSLLNKNQEEILISASFDLKNGKSLLVNHEKFAVKKMWGKFPSVFITPDDIQIILGNASDRRQFFDSSLSLFDIDYFNNLVLYQKYLKQRNTVLNQSLKKNWEINHLKQMIEPYDHYLTLYGNKIINLRQLYIPQLIALFENCYQDISNKKEKVDILLKSNCTESDFLVSLQSQLQKDMILGNTSIGPHKDDWVFMTNGISTKNTASQGQVKLFVIVLKLAVYEFFTHSNPNIKPILLLDDIFEKIDKYRIETLLKKVQNLAPNQIFITDTNMERLIKLLNLIAIPNKLFNFETGIENE